MKKLLIVWFSLFATAVFAQVKTPLQLYPDLFKAVQMNRIYADGKTFPDAVALKDATQINAAYKAASVKPGFNLKVFVNQYFSQPSVNADLFKSDPAQGIRKHIDTLWQVLQRNPDTVKGTSLIPLPHSYMVPGGRFREVYYWDSYFTMLGLQQAKKYELIAHVTDNFAYLLDNYGLIPNGNRTYYLTRSQPPFFALIVELLAKSRGNAALKMYQPQLLKEYSFWMAGAETLKAGNAYKHVVKLPDGTLLNRYWDDSSEPREESYREDVLASAKSKQKPADFYRNIRATAESGWDFSSRWFADGKSLGTIQTTSLIPVDLNCLLYHLETVLAKAYKLEGAKAQSAAFAARASKRKAAILKYCWSPAGYFTDYNWKTRSRSTEISIATAYPLFFNIASAAQAKQVSAKIKSDFLHTGGVATTLKNSGQQWDRPNGWAPLQYITVIGLKNYSENELAKTIATRWIKQNTEAFKQTGKLLEKYNIELQGEAAKAGGGEYPLQDGFGWTNGVLLTLMNMYGVK